MFDQSVTRVRPGMRTDRAGNIITDWALAERTPVSGLSVQPTVQTEGPATAERPALVVTGWHVLSEPGTAPDIRSSDRIEFGGLTCEVVGEVAAWPDPLDSSSVHHIEFTMRRTTG